MLPQKREFVRIHEGVLGNLDSLVAVDEAGAVTTISGSTSIPKKQKHEKKTNYEFYFPLLELAPKDAGKVAGMHYERDGNGRLLPSLSVEYASGEKTNIMVSKNGTGIMERENGAGFTSNPGLGVRDALNINDQKIIDAPESVKRKTVGINAEITNYHYGDGKNDYSIIIGTTPTKASWQFCETGRINEALAEKRVKNALEHGVDVAKKGLGRKFGKILPDTGDYIADTWTLGELLFYNKKYGSITPSAIFDVQSHKEKDGIYLNSAGYGGMEWMRDATVVINDLAQDRKYEKIVEKFFRHAGEVVERVVVGENRFPQRLRIDGKPTSEWGEQLDQPGQLLSSLEAYKEALDSRGENFRKKMFTKRNAKTARIVADYLSEKVEEAGGSIPSCMDPFERDWDKHSTSGCAIYAGLKAAAKFTGDAKYARTAEKLKPELISFWDESKGQFLRKRGDYNVDSLTSWYLDVLDLTNPKEYGMALRNTETIERVLGRKDEKGRIGIASIENSCYIGDNVWPWMTGLVGQAYCRLAEYAPDKTQKNGLLNRAESMLDYARTHTTMPGLLGEQVSPKTGKTVWASPLATSMAPVKELERALKTAKRY